MPFAYLVQCSDGSYYAGSTWNLQLRLHQHNSGDDGAAYTRGRRPVHLVWSVELESIAEAFGLEKQIQGWSRRKREALIDGRLDLLPLLSARSREAVVSRRSLRIAPQPPSDDG